MMCDSERSKLEGACCSRPHAEDRTRKGRKNPFGHTLTGAETLWDLAAESGEMATTVFVPSANIVDLSHMAMQLSKQYVGFKLEDSTKSKSWLLKAPWHMNHLDTILENKSIPSFEL